MHGPTDPGRRRGGLLAIAPPCVELVNRAVYRELCSGESIPVTIVVPDRYDFGRGLERRISIGGDGLDLRSLPVVGAHPRVRVLRGLRDVMEEVQPTHVLIDGDPASALTMQAASWTKGRGARLWVLTNENRPRRFHEESFRAMRRGRLGLAAGAAATAVLLQVARQSVDRVFVISRDGFESLEGMGFPGRVTRIPLGFDHELFFPYSEERREAIRDALGLTKPTVSYFGRVVREKGLLVLVEALARLKDQPWQFLLDRFSQYGTAFEDEVDEAIRAGGIGDRVVRFNARHEQIADYMNAADVVVLPSYTTEHFKEQYGRVVAEAMACRRLVVGTTCGAVPELIGDGGLVVPERDSRALEEALRTLLRGDLEIDALRDRGKRRADESMSVRTQAAIWARLLREDVDGGGACRR